ncbi:MAG: hypothetical protein ACYSYL_00185 [Planctomycetota bacterium]
MTINPGLLVQAKTIENIRWILDHRRQWKPQRRIIQLEQCQTRLAQLLTQREVSTDEARPLRAKLTQAIVETRGACRQRESARETETTPQSGMTG